MNVYIQQNRSVSVSVRFSDELSRFWFVYLKTKIQHLQNVQYIQWMSFHFFISTSYMPLTFANILQSLRFTIRHSILKKRTFYIKHTRVHTHIQWELLCRVSGPVPPTISLNVSLVLEVWSCQHCSLATLDANSCVYLPMINTQVTADILAL